MGDILEFTTWPKHQTVFYKINNNALVFEVKGERSAVIGLARKPGECNYWILLGFNDECWIKKITTTRNSPTVFAPIVLSRENYQKFWITWNNGKINVGKGDKKSPFISKHIPICDLNYVTFSVMDARYALLWKVNLPPQIKKPTPKIISGGEPYWVGTDGRIPNDAIIGGYENGTLYIIRSLFFGSMIPGKFVPSLGSAFLTRNGGVQETNKFEMLCGYNYKWVKTQRNNIPVGAVASGCSENGEEKIYVGRAICGNHLIPGKVQPSRNCCYVAYSGHELRSQVYEILVALDTVNESANDSYITNVDIRNDVLDNPFESDEEEEVYSKEENKMFVF